MPPAGSATPDQLHFEFPRIEEDERPLVETGNYRPVLATLRGWKTWPDGQLALLGGPGSGKTRLLRTWAAEAGGAFITGAALGAARMERIAELSLAALAIDDADQAASGIHLFSAMNLCRHQNAPILLSGSDLPPGWFAQPPDLVSRLRAIPHVMIETPDDETLKLRLKDACVRRHLNVPEASLDYLVMRMEPRWDAIETIADQIERTRGRGYTLASARKVLDALDMNTD